MNVISNNAKINEEKKLQICCLINIDMLSNQCLKNLNIHFGLHFVNFNHLEFNQLSKETYDMIICDTTQLSLINLHNKKQLFDDLKMILFLMVSDEETVQVKLLTHPLVNKTIIISKQEIHLANRIIKSYNIEKGSLNYLKEKDSIFSQCQETSITSFIECFNKIILEKSETSNLCIEDIARSLSLSPSCLRKKIKQATGNTVVKYMLQYRLKIARNLLEYEDYNVQETAMKMGFMSNSYFTKSFKAMFGNVPSYYLENH